MKTSEYLKSQTSAENYKHIWGQEETIPKVMDRLFVDRKEILWSVEDRINWHRTECRFSKNCSTCEVLFYLKKHIVSEEK